MPNRILREGFLDSERINGLSDAAQLFFVRLMLVVDDYGRYDARPELLKSKCYPVSDIRPTRIRQLLEELKQSNNICLYFVESKEYLEIKEFGQRTRIMRSKFPCPPVDGRASDGCRADVGVNPIQSESNPIQSETESDTKQGNGVCGCDETDNNACPEKTKTWRTDYDTYAEEAKIAIQTLLEDSEWLAVRQSYHPLLDIRMSVMKAANDYWLQESGWAQKKAKRTTKKIDWEATMNNALSLKCNQVYAKVPPRQR